jgi:hypothetical protein
MNPDDKPDSLIVRPLTYEQMSEAERQYYDPRRRHRPQVPEAIYEYNPYRAFDDEVEPFHRNKS